LCVYYIKEKIMSRYGGALIIPALGKQRQENFRLEASLGYMRPCLKKKTFKKIHRLSGR
jgi:hypothetical protein